MSEVTLELVLEMIGAPIATRRPLPDGTNPWEIVVYDPKRVQQVAARKRYHDVVERRGVLITCENPDCGTQWKVHPSMVGRTFACSVACSSKMYAERKAGRSDRTPINLPWKPWESKEQNRKEAS